MIKLISILGCLLLLSACQVMSVADCQTANWTELGKQDGLKGLAARTQARADSCQKQGIAIPKVELERYQLAYEKSIRQYCQPENIFDRALVGSARISSCPEPEYSRVKPIYDVANGYYENKNKIDTLRKEIHDLEDRLMVNTDKELKDRWLAERARKSRELERLLLDELRYERELDYIRPY